MTGIGLTRGAAYDPGSAARRPPGFHPDAGAWPVLAAVLFLLLAPAGAKATELRIRVDPARVERAELLVVAWGSAERYPLETAFDEAGRQYVRLPLDSDWLEARWSRFPDMLAAYVHLRFYGPFVAIRSERFVWVGMRDAPDGPPAGAFDIDFGRGRRVRVTPGDTREIALAPRQPEARQIRLVDEGGRPVTDALVSAYMFWSDSNHCGVLAGGDPLVRLVRPNASGIVTLPDGDFEYTIEVSGPSMRVIDPATNDFGVFRTHLPTAERVVRIHRLRRQPLSMRITVGAAPGKHVPVSGTAARCACGACSGMIAMADEEGRLRIDDFYPEEYRCDLHRRRSGRRHLEAVGLQPDQAAADRCAPGGSTARHRDVLRATHLEAGGSGLGAGGLTVTSRSG